MAGQARTRRRRASVTQVLGEVLITLGVIVALYLAWQVWFNNEVSSAVQSATSNALSQQFAKDAGTGSSSSAASPTSGADDAPVVAAPPKPEQTFANLIVPRFGADFIRPITEGVGFSVLNNISRGIGHYPGSQMPGEIGNFAIASHRSAYGGAFHVIQYLRVGDPIYIETQDGWYEYIYRDSEYVLPTGVGVVAPVPDDPNAKATQRLITLTTCNPLYSSAERIAAFGVFAKFYPRAGGPPAGIAAVVGGSK